MALMALMALMAKCTSVCHQTVMLCMLMQPNWEFHLLIFSILTMKQKRVENFIGMMTAKHGGIRYIYTTRCLESLGK